MPQLDFSTYLGQIFWLVVCFALLYCFIKFWFYPKMQSSLQQRNELVQNLVLEAKELKDKAQALNHSYFEQVADLNNKIEQINEQTKDFCKQHYDEQTAVFHEECNKQKEKVMADLVIWENSLQTRSKDIALDIASFMLAKLLTSLDANEEKAFDLKKYYDKVKN